MDTSHRKALETFDVSSLPDLDTVVLGALERFAVEPVPALTLSGGERTVVIGSGNAAVLGQLLFDTPGTRYATESTYQRVFDTAPIDTAVLISASGSKHAIEIAAACTERGIDTWLLTNTEGSPAAAHLDPSRVRVFPKNREPYTYNTSTYLGMLLARTEEDPTAIHQFITEQVAAALPQNLGSYDAFYCIVPPEMLPVRDMVRTKFDELFGARVSVRIFTLEESKHAKTVVPSDTECFLSFGVQNELFGTPAHRVFVPLPENARYAAMLAISYFVVGNIQKQHPPYFKGHIAGYVADASRLFGQTISPIVE